MSDCLRVRGGEWLWIIRKFLFDVIAESLGFDDGGGICANGQDIE